ncbi:MAG TPA: Ref family recombination enhancement nuclease [Terriglobales bacterium]
MKRSPLQRKTPLKSGSWKRSPLAPADRLTAMKRSEMKSRVKKPAATAAEKRHMDAVVRLGCIACRNSGLGETPCEIHHVRFLAGAGQRASHMDVLGLCPPHHRTGGHGIAIHDGRETWESIHGTESDLLAQTRRELGIEQQELEVA